MNQATLPDEAVPLDAAAKMLGTTRPKLKARLQALAIFTADGKPKPYYRQAGYFRVENRCARYRGMPTKLRHYEIVLVTPAGRKFLENIKDQICCAS